MDESQHQQPYVAAAQPQFLHPAYAHPPFVMMPAARQRNGLGAFGFFVALIGLLIPTGIVCLLGLMLSLAAIGRSPRGFAAGGVIVGLLGTVLWATIMLGIVVVGVGAAAFGALFVAGAFLFMQPELVETSADMVNVVIAVQEYEEDHDEMPTELSALGLSLATSLDPWGAKYRLVVGENAASSDLGFDVVSRGPDGEFGTEDDVSLSRLDRHWEIALEDFDQTMEEFGRRMERLEGLQYTARGHRYNVVCTDPAQIYVDAAVRELEGRERIEAVAALDEPVVGSVEIPVPVPVPVPAEVEPELEEAGPESVEPPDEAAEAALEADPIAGTGG